MAKFDRGKGGRGEGRSNTNNFNALTTTVFVCCVLSIVCCCKIIDYGYAYACAPHLVQLK